MVAQELAIANLKKGIAEIEVSQSREQTVALTTWHKETLTRMADDQSISEAKITPARELLDR